MCPDLSEVLDQGRFPELHRDANYALRKLPE